MSALEIEVVGYNTATAINTTGASLSLTALTGGSASAPSEGDLVIVGYAQAVRSISAPRTPSITSSGYTLIDTVTGLDGYNAALAVYYKVMGATPDTTITGGGGPETDTSSAMFAIAIRNFDPAYFDVTATKIGRSDSPIPTPPAITTVTDGVKIIAFSASASTSGTANYSAYGNMTGYTSIGADSGLNDTAIGAAYNDQTTAGTFTPTAWTFTGFNGPAFSSASVTVAIKPLVSKKLGFMAFF